MENNSLQQFSISPATGNVDRENLRINAAIIGEQIDPKDYRNIVLDDFFMQSYVELTRGKELKMRLDHPWFTQTGDTVGFISNIQFQDKKLVGDIQLLESARKSPVFANTDVVEYILSAVEEHAKTVMLSMVTAATYFSKDRMFEVERFFDWNSYSFSWRNKETKEKYDGHVTMTPTEAYSVDFVDEGALTNQMFNQEAQVVECFSLMLENKEARSTFQKNQEKIFQTQESGLKIGEFLKELKEEIKSIFMSQKENKTHGTTGDPITAAPVATPTPPSTNSVESPKPGEHEFVSKTEFDALTKQIDQLTASFTEFSKSPAGEHAGANGGAVVAAEQKKEELPAYKRNPMNAHLYQKVEK